MLNSNPRAGGDTPQGARKSGSTLPDSEPNRQVHRPSSQEAEQVRIQTALDAIEACPPVGRVEQVAWKSLRWFYKRRLQSIREVRKSPASAEGPHAFEPALVRIPAGEFLMGGDPAQDRDAMRIEEPQHTVTLADYFLARTPVTNAQYEAFVLDSGHSPPTHWKKGKPPRGRGDPPVVRVSWYDAADYCRWLSEATGRPYRLPTEAEWEKAARGTGGGIYPWGDTWDAKRCNTKESGSGDTTPVGAYPRGASPYGLMDMAGNVWEWTSSRLWDYPYQAGDGREDPS